MSSALQRYLNRFNAGRRERILTSQQVIDFSLGVLPGEHKFLHGGWRTQSHNLWRRNFNEKSTGAIVFRIADGKAFVVAKVIPAKRTSTGFGRIDKWRPPQFLEGFVLVHDALKHAEELTQMNAPIPILADACFDLGHDKLAMILQRIQLVGN